MFEFFRARSGWNLNAVNPQYWAEKIVTGSEGVRRYSEDRFRQFVTEHVQGVAADYPDGLLKAVWDFRYLWRCHAIQWGIDRYDAAKATTPQSDTEVSG